MVTTDRPSKAYGQESEDAGGENVQHHTDGCADLRHFQPMKRNDARRAKQNKYEV